MVAWSNKRFGGMIPRLESRLLPENRAEAAVNCDLSSGAAVGFSAPIVAHAFSPGTNARRAYRLPGPDAGDADAWLALPSEFSSVVRSPLANDTNRRIYWTNPDSAGAPYWNTYDRLIAGTAPYNLGIVQPSTTVGPTAAATGGSATEVSRAYVYTYANEFGEESAPSLPSAVVSGPSDATWSITGLPAAAPANPAGYNYPAVVKLHLYRTVTGQQTGAQYFLVKTFTYNTDLPPFSYTDTTSDSLIINNTALATTDWGNPPDGLDGLRALPGGMLVGFTANTIHFSEPNRAHTWPAGYDQSLLYDIIGFALWQQSLVVLTQGFPSTGQGNSPANYVFTQAQVYEPCLSRGSVVTDMSGVYYASQNGLVRLNYYGMQVQTTQLVSEDDWINTYYAADIVACRHKTQYLAVNGTGAGFVIDFAKGSDKEPLSLVELSTFEDAVGVWSDEYNGDTYIMAGDTVYIWDDPSGDTLVYRWRSKEFYSPIPLTMGACQVASDIAIETAPVNPTAPALDNGDATLTLASDVNATFKLYAGGELKFTKTLTQRNEIFRLPSGFKAFEWQYEIVSRVKIHSVEVASTMRELSRV